jgi:hypothetical protein
MSRKPGLGTVSTRTREEAREAAGRISPESGVADAQAVAPQPSNGTTPPVSTSPPAEVQTGPDPGLDADTDTDADADEEFDSEDEPEPQRTVAAVPPDTPKVSTRGRRRAPALPDSLTPSRVSQRRIQIGPRLRPSIHTDFNDYCLKLANIGVTQSDVVESALVEYMKRYPAEELRAALLAGE